MYCARHPEADARWECLRCRALHCDGCVRRIGTPPREVRACSHCDGMLRAFEVQVVPPAGTRIRELLARPFSATGLATIAVIAVVGGASDVPIPLLDVTVTGGYLTLLAGSYFNLVDHVASGHRGFPAPVETTGWPPGTLALRGLLLLLVAFAPFGLWLALDRGAENVKELFARNPATAVALLLLVQIWLTAALLAVLNTASGLAAFWPPALVAVVARAPGLFSRLVLLVVASGLACWGARRVVGTIVGALPFLSGFSLAAVTAIVLLAQGALVGGFVREHSEVYRTR